MATDLGSDMSLGRKLRRRRKQTGKTMQSVADEAGLSVGFISQVERDLSSPPQVQEAFAQVAIGDGILAIFPLNGHHDAAKDALAAATSVVSEMSAC